MKALDNPVWHSLVGRHAHLGEGGPLARRYSPDVNVFVAVEDGQPEALDALMRLVRPGETAFVMRRDPIPIPDAFAITSSRPAVQLVSVETPPAPAETDDVLLLTETDALEMRALAQLTEPGPFLERTHRMGRFFGVREGGRLVAMAGERLRPHGFTELSGVCTHPEVRGRGLARRLTALVASEIIRRGETPFLHSWADNAPAIALYEQLGFAIRTDVFVAVAQRLAD